MKKKQGHIKNSLVNGSIGCFKQDDNHKGQGKNKKHDNPAHHQLFINKKIKGNKKQGCQNQHKIRRPDNIVSKIGQAEIESPYTGKQ
jgi:hypothetical protein